MEKIIDSLFLLRLKWPLFLLLPLFILTISFPLSAAQQGSINYSSMKLLLDQLQIGLDYRTVLSFLLVFIAASVSSAGGIGGGSLYLPILNLVTGLDLKTAATYSAFMVTGGSLANVLYNLFVAATAATPTPSINYDIALLSQPSMLLGVSLGVICHTMFPEWLITLQFGVFLACTTYRTCIAGFKLWNSETEEMQTRAVYQLMLESSTSNASVEENLLVRQQVTNIGGGKRGSKNMVVLVLMWLCFLLVHVLMADKNGEGALKIKACGAAYWFITFFQVPLCVSFTLYVVYEKRKSDANGVQQQLESSNQEKGRMRNIEEAVPLIVFPLAALVTGVLSGLFGIGGGLLLNPLLLHIGLSPQGAAATSTFMVMFSASMTTIKYVMLGMAGVDVGLRYAVVCFVASVVGFGAMERIIVKSGRVSVIVFTVTTVMALSTTTIVCYGIVDVLKEYTSGNYMGFRPPC